MLICVSLQQRYCRVSSLKKLWRTIWRWSFSTADQNSKIVHLALPFGTISFLSTLSTSATALHCWTVSNLSWQLTMLEQVPWCRTLFHTQFQLYEDTLNTPLQLLSPLALLRSKLRVISWQLQPIRNAMMFSLMAVGPWAVYSVYLRSSWLSTSLLHPSWSHFKLI